MRGDDPIVSLIMFAMALWLLRMWWLDTQQARDKGVSEKHYLPGHFFASKSCIVLASLGALVILSFEVVGEYALGIVEEQEMIGVVFLLSILGAAVIEEVVFRGYLVFAHRGRLAFWAGILGCSVVFTLLHPYLWSFEPPSDSSWQFWRGTWECHWDDKAFFSSALVFTNSLWFYAVRFLPNNPQHSLLPCFVAHAVSNLGVFVVKAFQGFIDYSLF